VRILVTGGCGFIGSAVVRHLIEETEHEVVNVDTMTYAATEGSVASVAGDERYRHLEIDIRDADAVEAAFVDHQPDAVMHLAAESHVDRSIDGPEEFLLTNIVGTMQLLQASRRLMATRSDGGVDFRFLHVSTDEVFGDLDHDADPFDESTPYNPRSPYSASKAGVISLTRSHALEFGRAKIRVNAVVPGGVDTDMLRDLALSFADTVEAGYEILAKDAKAQRRIADPSEIAGPVLYLASDLASFVTGATHVVDGGEVID